jgi:hypothetical protein
MQYLYHGSSCNAGPHFGILKFDRHCAYSEHFFITDRLEKTLVLARIKTFYVCCGVGEYWSPIFMNQQLLGRE